MAHQTYTPPPRGRVVGRTAPDGDGIAYPVVKVDYCTCGAGPLVHEPHCGTDMDDSRPIRVFWPETET